MKSEVKNSKPIDTVDLASKGIEHEIKETRTRSTSKISLAIMVQVKQEKNDAVAILNSARKAQEDVEADLKEVKDDLGDANNRVEHTCLAHNICMGRLTALVLLHSTLRVFMFKNPLHTRGIVKVVNICFLLFFILASAT